MLYRLKGISRSLERRRLYTSKGRNSHKNRQGNHTKNVFSKQGEKAGLGVFHVTFVFYKTHRKVRLGTLHKSVLVK